MLILTPFGPVDVALKSASWPPIAAEFTEKTGEVVAELVAYW